VRTALNSPGVPSSTCGPRQRHAGESDSAAAHSKAESGAGTAGRRG
jgi:hypothetical protein